jgi:two-component system CheB/CheR fusion protein
MPPTKKTLSSESEGNHSFITVGLGASAGGVEALKKFFAGMPPDSGMAFVVILHLSPEHESNLPSILQNETEMPVLQVTEEVRVEPNHVYVIPPNRNLAMSDGIIRLVKSEKRGGSRVAIDTFFRTLADARGENSVCVILSGTGSDGTLGLKQIKEREGFAIAQDPDDAEYDGMPRSAIATDLVDWVLPVAEMPKKLIGFRESSEQLNLTNPDAKAPAEVKGIESRQELLTLIRVRTGHDFSNYKQATLIRRIARHLQIYELEDIPSYIKLLRERPEDIQSLIKNLLINVTNFFRDREAFNALEKEIVPRLFAGKTGKDSIRVWSAGCASGEEAYSLAILLCEYASKLSDPPKLQIFATDVDEDAIAEAREHRYPEAIEADVSPERLRQFFVKTDGYYRVRKNLREIILFAPHNILRDPPFSRLDLVSCRNLLIYLNRETQDRVLQIFHFALKPDGYLFLGNSESAEAQTNLYIPVDKKQRIYTRRPSVNAAQKPPELPIKGDWRIDIPELPVPPARPRLISFGEMHYKLVEQYAPPSMLVNEDFEIVHLSENAGVFLRFTGGEPSNNLLKAIHPDLLADLRAALFTTQREGVTSEMNNIRVMLNGKETFVNLVVRQVDIAEAGNNYLLIIVEEIDHKPGAAKNGEQTIQVAKDDAMETVTRRLEEDLRRTKDRLRTTIEQHETSIEELKASNEEMQAINEELRSASEELETSKEELQSVNEELTTVNQELKDKIDDLSRSNSDMQNFMAATDIGTIFLDRGLAIKRYTPAAQRLFNVIPTDIGRPLEHVTHKLSYSELLRDAAEVLDSLKTLEREVRTNDGRWFIARLLPYRSLEDKIDGVIVNFIDITERKRAQEGLRQSEERMRLIIESAKDFAIFTTDLKRRINTWNPGAKAMFGYSGNEILNKSADILFTPEDRKKGDPEREAEIAAATGHAENERWHGRKDGTRFYGSGLAMPLCDDEGSIIGFVKIMRDLTERKQAEEDLVEANRQKDVFLATLSHELRNPLASIRSGLDVIKGENTPKRDFARALETVERQAGQIARLVDDLLDISRISRGKISLKKEVVDLGNAVDVAIEANRERITAKNQILTLTKPEKPIFLEADLTRLTQIIVNLLSNASKYTEPGGSIWISSNVENGDVVIRIIDNGSGIAASKLSEIFDMFRQGENEKSTSEGLGVDLSLAKKLVELHGGTIAAFSDGEDKGSEFVVKLPMVIPLGFKPGKTKAAEKPAEDVTVKPKRILVIDDNVDAAQMLGVLLRQDNHDVHIVHDGREGVTEAGKFKPEIVLLDIGLPRMDGYEVAKRIRKKLPNLYLIAISGWGQERDQKLSAEAGFDKHLVKPVEFEELNRILAEAAGD